jgi:hypothetical protein
LRPEATTSAEVAEPVSRNRLDAKKSFIATGEMTGVQPHLSIVATSRNDDHGGNLTKRMQSFVDGLVYQADRAGTHVELILVEWNPPSDRPPLAEILRWPPPDSFLTCRVITVPEAVHGRIMPHEGFGMMQMIAKNVGIRAAQGPWILATNIDILFPDDVFDLMLGSLDHRNLYRVDRVDVPFPFPEELETNIEKLLVWCASNPLRIAYQRGSWVQGAGLVAPVAQSLPDLLRIMGTRLWQRYRNRISPSINDSTRQTWEAMEVLRRDQRDPHLYVRTKQRVTAIGRVAVLPKLHTNACGDFTLLAKEAWHELRGYPEWPVHSLHIDSVFLWQAYAAGIRIVPIGGSNAIYHMEHSLASGWTPEGAKAHLDRIEKIGVRTISADEMRSLEWKLFVKHGQVMRYNDTNWGCALDELRELRPTN